MTITKSFLILSLLILLHACSKESAPEQNQNKEDVAFARPGQQGGNSAAYFTYFNSLEVADALISVNSSVSEMAQIHESYKTDDGLIGMREFKQPVIEANGNLDFTQGGVHIMLMKLQRELSQGDTITIEMEWSQKGMVQKKIPVKSFR